MALTRRARLLARQRDAASTPPDVGREGQHDRALHLDDAERAEGVDHAGGGGPALSRPPDRHRQGRRSSIPTSSRSPPTTRSRPSSTPTTGSISWSSGAILLYLAEKTGKLWPQEFPTKWRVVEWLMWQMGGPGPFLGQVHHFVKFNPGKSAYAEERYAKEAKRLWAVLDRRLARSSMSPATIRSPTSPFGRGSPASPGRR